MRIVRILGGIGNQMFQYAFYKKLEEIDNDVKIDCTGFENYRLHNGYELEKIFNIDAKYANLMEVKQISNISDNIFLKVIRKIFGGKENEFIENGLVYNPHLLTNKKIYYYDGYWQSYKYFQDIQNKIKNEFSFKNELDQLNLRYAERILKDNSVSIHIRRGDYISNKRAEKVLNNICTKEYYEKAVSEIYKRFECPTFYIFSDDMDWVKSNIYFGDNCTFVDWNNGKDSYKDMQLMSLCKHNIIANSSFSWWGAYLNSYDAKIVISPNKWTNDGKSNIDDIIPNKWIRV